MLCCKILKINIVLTNKIILFFMILHLITNVTIPTGEYLNLSRGATLDDFSGHFFRIFEIIIVCFVVAICKLVHDVEAIFHLSNVLTASGNLF